MTLRAIILGLVCAAVLNGFCYFNDMVLRQTFLVGSYLPLPVYGGLLLFVVLVNPLLVRIGKQWGFRGRELAVVVALVLSACYVPGRGLMHYFLTFQMLPHHYQQTTPGWQKADAISMAPKRMLADPEAGGGEALSGYIQGLKEGSKNISFADIPWEAWTSSLGFWIPLLLTFSIGITGLALVVHRQWSDHEHLAYPIATFADSLFSDSEGRLAAVLRNRAFWYAAMAVFTIHMINYAQTWWPDVLIPFRRSFDFGPILSYFPTWGRGGAWMLFHPTVYFCVIGFAYFLSTDVSLSLGIAPFLYTFVVGWLLGYGVRVGGPHLSMKMESFFHTGAFAAMFLTLLYTGRHYYLSTLKRCFRPRGVEGWDSHAVWGMRVFFVCMASFVIQLEWVGLDWQLGVLYTIGAVMIFVVTSRVVVETGAFFIHPWIYPCAMVWAVLGSQSLGPETLLIMLMVSSLLLIDPREAVMPFVQHALKIADLQKVSVGKTAGAGVVALIVAFAVATPVSLYWQYNEGAFVASDGWCNRAVPTMGIHQAVDVKYKLEAQGTLEQARSVSGWSRFLDLSPNVPCLISFGVVFALALLCSLGRLHFPKWPIHPVLFIVLGTFQSKMLGPSFLLGWLIKCMVNKYGGATLYQKLKPLMIGLIAGEMLGGVVPMAIGFIYYLCTGETPKSFSVFRG